MIVAHARLEERCNAARAAGRHGTPLAGRLLRCLARTLFARRGLAHHAPLGTPALIPALHAAATSRAHSCNQRCTSNS